MELVVPLLDSAVIEYLRHHRKLPWTALLLTLCLLKPGGFEEANGVLDIRELRGILELAKKRRKLLTECQVKLNRFEIQLIQMRSCWEGL